MIYLSCPGSIGKNISCETDQLVIKHVPELQGISATGIQKAAAQTTNSLLSLALWT